MLAFRGEGASHSPSAARELWSVLPICRRGDEDPDRCMSEWRQDSPCIGTAESRLIPVLPCVVLELGARLLWRGTYMFAFQGE